MSGEFHIHIDAKVISEDFERTLTAELGFWRADFDGSPEGAVCFAPVHHLTNKYPTNVAFRTAWDRVIQFASVPGAMCGYIEGEYVPEEIAIPEAPFDPGAAPPFRIEMAALPPGKFRETEVHVTLDRDRSDPRLLTALQGMGLMAVYLPKPYGTAVIYTVQGSVQHIDRILTALVSYLTRAGGAVKCRLKEEGINRHWISGPDAVLPPVVGKIHWSEN